MPLIKLTPKNQLQSFYQDIGRMNAGDPMLHSIGQHIELLIQRVAALEALAGEAGTAATVKQDAVHEHATAQPERPNSTAILPNKERP